MAVVQAVVEDCMFRFGYNHPVADSAAAAVAVGSVEMVVGAEVVVSVVGLAAGAAVGAEVGLAADLDWVAAGSVAGSAGASMRFPTV